jgi:putative intracellular protease/amidase
MNAGFPRHGPSSGGACEPFASSIRASPKLDSPLRVLVVLTSHDRLTSGRRTGVCLSSFAAGYYAFVDAALEVSICSPLGGPAPITPTPDRDAADDIVQRFYQDPIAREEFSDGLMLSQVCAGDFSAVYYPDGAGALWDLAHDRESQALLWQMHELQRPCAFVGYGTAALLSARGPDQVPLVAARSLTAPGRAVDDGLPADAPSLPRQFVALGAICIVGEGAGPFMVQSGGLITGRDADASALVAQAMIASAS